MKKITIIAVLIIVITAIQAIAGPNWNSGNVTNYTAIQGGILIMLDTGVPDNCAGTPYGWMIVAEEDKALTAMVLMKINQENMGATVYSGGTFYRGICRVIQYEPAQ